MERRIKKVLCVSVCVCACVYVYVYVYVCVCVVRVVECVCVCVLFPSLPSLNFVPWCVCVFVGSSGNGEAADH